ncbi:MAG: leucine-rich repeat domain-containing protein [Promethearchaeota archaeon]
MAEHRDYYINVHGFDPVRDRIALKNGGASYRYEHCFELANDPILFEKGVKICARVEVDFGTVRNRIVFKRGSSEATVDCVHTAVCVLEVEEAFSAYSDGEKIVELSRSTENRPVNLIPEEHFVSLKSYVGGLAEFGIGALLNASYHSETINPMILPFGFNSAMQKQVVHALRKVAPEATRLLIREHILYLARSVTREWFTARLGLINNIYGIRDAIFTDPDAFMELYELTKHDRLLLDCASYPHTHPWILKNLPLEDCPWIKTALAENSSTLPEILESLAADPDVDIRIRVARNPSAPPKSLHILAESGDLRVKRLVAKNPRTPPATLFVLSSELDPEVRLALAENPRSPAVILDRLALTITSDDPELKYKLAVNSATPPAALEMLASVDDLKLKQLLAHNVKTPLWVLDKLAEEDATVRVKVEKNPSCTAQILEKIKKARRERISLSSYHGQEGIFRRDADALATLEDDLGTRFQQRSGKAQETYYVLKGHRVVELGLRNKNLSELPPVVEALENLEHLDLSGNSLGALPESLAKMSNLRELLLSGNNLSELPDCVRQMFLIEVLDLSGNNLSTLPRDIGAFKFLRILNLEGNKLTRIPEELGYLPSLQVLNLSRNNLVEIPETLGVLLKELRVFLLNTNRVERLPQTFGSLEKLEVLDLSNNQIAQLPDSMSGLGVLRELILSNNQLTTLRGTISGLKNLEKLEARHNKLFYVPESIGTLEKLTKIDFGNNHLTGLPWSIGRLANLKALLLDHNLLTVLPEPVTSLRELEVLNLESNLIEFLPDLEFFSSLRSFNVFSNPLPRETIAKIQKEIPYPPLKIFLLGDGGVGKTTLLQKYVNGKFIPDTSMTIGVDFFTKIVEFEPGCFVRVHFWDVSGVERFRFMLPSYMRGTTGAIFTVDLTRFITLEDISSWVELVRGTVGDVPIILVGLKVDLDDQRSIETDYLKEYLKELQFDGLFLASAKTGEQVEELFLDITRRAMSWRDEHLR